MIAKIGNQKTILGPRKTYQIDEASHQAEVKIIAKKLPAILAIDDQELATKKIIAADKKLKNKTKEIDLAIEDIEKGNVEKISLENFKKQLEELY